MAGSPSIEQIIAQIRTAIFGKDVRENIALGIEKCYADATNINVSVTRIGQTDDYRLNITYR